MKYTPEELSKLSNSEINKLFAWHADLNYGLNAVPNFCRSYGNTMPIAFESEISLNCQGELDDGCVYWEASSNYPLRMIDHENPLRAICEVFILMNQGEKS